MNTPRIELEQRVQALAKKIYARNGSLPVIDRQQQPEQWRAWRQWRKEHGLKVNFMDKQQRWTVITDWPPADLAALETEYRTGGKTRL